MARQTIASEFNSFVGGLITEASPLTFPGNAALDINNFNIDKDGTISRRLGMDYEPGHVVVDSGITPDASGEVGISTFMWRNAGGNAKTSVAVVQTGNVLKFFDTGLSAVTPNLVHTHTFTEAGVDVSLSAAVVDGILVVVGAGKEPSSFVYEDGVIDAESYSLKIRDTFGVEAYGVVPIKGFVGPLPLTDLRSPPNINSRPEADTIGSEHIYNLRNSTYSPPRINENRDADGPRDPIEIFVSGTNTMPSNSDAVTSALFANPENSNDRFVERFFDGSLRNSPVGNFESPKGYFIIDALERGTSRLQEVSRLVNQTYPDIDYSRFPVDTLPLDRTPGGATAVGEYAGRVWYAGFSGEVVGGDAYSPRMSSHILFSSLVSARAELGNCHQIGDPTSKEAPDLLETDGGFIRLDEAYGIRKLVNIGSGLVVVAENGVWAIVGGSDFGFTATTYKVIKVTNHGCTNKDSVVLVDNSVLYWGDDGIYQVSRSEIGDLTAVNITNTTIQSVYDEVSDLEKASVQGHFDTYDRKVRWLFKNRVSPVEDTRELVLDVTLSAFYLNTIPTVGLNAPNAVAYIEVPPFKVGSITENVVHEGELVTHEGEQVVHTSVIDVDGLREVLYLTITSTSPTVTYTMSKYSDKDFTDWKTFDGEGVDSPAQLITGFNGGGDFQRNKQVPYITFHLEKTEEGFEDDGLGNISPTHESSCLVTAQWGWATSSTTGRWSREFQAYRHKRAYLPESVSDSFNDGFEVVSTKNKLRGKGKVLSLQIKTEPMKDLRLLGWSMITSVANNV